MEISTRVSVCLIAAAISFGSLPAFAGHQDCKLGGTYGYLYNGTSYGPSGATPLTETGVLTVDEHGGVRGEGALAFQFSSFGAGGPLWLLLNEVQSGVNSVTPSPNNACVGTIDFFATATVIKTSDPARVPEGTVLFSNKPRSIAYTISGSKNEIVDLISTSPGTIASGTAHKQEKN